jgi:hypothetical protein
MRYAVPQCTDSQAEERSSALKPSRRPLKFDTPAGYRIRVEGPLDERWSDYLGGMTISSANRSGEPTVTTLTGELVDQAALMGVLNTVYDLGFTLLKVERLAGTETVSDIKHTGGIQ